MAPSQSTWNGKLPTIRWLGDALRRLSVRKRFVGLLLIIGSAIFLVVAVGTNEIASRTERSERLALRDSARYLARRHLSEWDTVSFELTGLATTPSSQKNCNAVLKRLILHSPASIGVAGMITSNVTIRCSVSATSKDAVDKKWFSPSLIQEALATNRTVTVIRSVGHGHRSVELLVHRMHSAHGPSHVLIFATIRFGSMGGLLPTFDGKKLMVALFDQRGQLVDDYPAHNAIGVFTPAFIHRIDHIFYSAGDGGSYEAMVGGMVIGYTMIGNDLGYVVTVIPRSSLYRPAAMALWRNIGIALIILTLAIALGWRLLLAPLIVCAGSLKKAAEALASGDLDARANVHEGCGEFGHVAESFNAMAQALADRTRIAERTASELTHISRIQRIQSQVQRIPVANGELSEFLESICTTATRDGEIAGTWIVTMDRPENAPKVLATSGLEEKITDCRKQPRCNPLCPVRMLLADAFRDRKPKQATIPLKGVGSGHKMATVVICPNVADPSSDYLIIFYILEHSFFTSQYQEYIYELGNEIHARILADEAVRKASYLETHDSVTGLLNRVTNVQRLAQILPEVLAGPDEVPCAVLIISFVNLWPIAEIDGQRIGDEIWSAVAGRLSALATLSGALLAHTRLGFFCSLFRRESILAVQREAASIVSALSAPLTISNGEVIYPEFRVGIAVAPRDGEKAETLLDHARQALANPSGDQVVFFSKAIDTQIQEDRRLEVALRDAIENDGLEFHYQPVVDAVSGHAVGFETLARWPHGPNGEPVSPARFIPIAERSQLIVSLGNLAMRTAVKQAAIWARDGHTGLQISLNVSAAQFRHPDFLKDVTAALDLGGTTLASNRIAFEITESLLVDNTDETRKLLLRLNDLGFLLYLDDFGTGWSSLSYLHTLPFHTLKIDRSFVQPMAKNRKIYGIARTIQACADMLKLDVIAEGVETEVQAALLRKMGCRYIQGYLTGRPAPAEEVTKLLERDRKTPMTGT